MDETAIRGHLVIFVDGYKYHYKGLTHLVEQDGKRFAVPDRLMPSETNEIGSMDWWHNGWAVGDNSRDRLCSRLGSKPLRKFLDFDEAVQFVFSRQRKFKAQQHVLVYVTKNLNGHEEKHIVHSLDDIVCKAIP